jgi:signal transduction histidine kinase
MRQLLLVLLYCFTLGATPQSFYHVDHTRLLEVTDLIQEPLYQLKMDQVKKVLNSHLHNSKRGVGIVLVDEFDALDAPTLSLWKEGYDSNNSNITRVSLPILHLKSKRPIGTIYFYELIDNAKFYLTEQEKQYLKEKQTIHVCIDPNWMPFEKIEGSEYIGVSAEYMKFFSHKIKTPILLKATTSWSESLTKAQNRECDILSLTVKTQERESYMDYTSSYIDTPIVVATKMGVPFIEDLKYIEDKPLAVVKDYALLKILKKDYPNMNIVAVDSITDGLEKVQNGELFGYLDSSPVINYHIQKDYIGILSISGKFKEVLKLHIATRNDEKLLHVIFQRLIQSIDSKTHQMLQNRWISVNYTVKVDYTLVYKILFFSLLIIFFIIYWNIRLKKEIQKRHLVEQELKELNMTLESRVQKSVEEIHHKELLLQQQSRLAQMGEIINMIAHQWRQPLGATGAVIIAIQTKIRLKKFDDLETFEHYLNEKFKTVFDYINLMTQTIDEFRNFFKKDRILECEDVSTLVRKSLHVIVPYFDTKEIKVVKNLESCTKIYLYQNEVIQVILNILKNADDAFDDSSCSDKKIYIRTYETKESVVIEICDNAGGISAEIQEKIFDPYFSTKAAKNGTGIGLYMSKIIIEEHHGGSMTLKNIDEGDGTTVGACFRVTLNNNTKEKR